RRPNFNMGDAYALVAKEHLTIGAPYPGDERFGRKPGFFLHKNLRFQVVKVHKRKFYVIVDNLTDFYIRIPKTLLQNPKFDLRNWYSRRRSKALRLPRVKRPLMSIGYAVPQRTVELLTEGINY
ncbi:hypothetical protein BJ912DRAFT_828482, partial [Pholiota molesta]